MNERVPVNAVLNESLDIATTAVRTSILSAVERGSRGLPLSPDAQRVLSGYLDSILSERFVSNWEQIQSGVLIKGRYAGRQCWRKARQASQLFVSGVMMQQAIAEAKAVVISPWC